MNVFELFVLGNHCTYMDFTQIKHCLKSALKRVIFCCTLRTNKPDQTLFPRLCKTNHENVIKNTQSVKLNGHVVPLHTALPPYSNSHFGPS